jgi:hypothetical protein
MMVPSFDLAADADDATFAGVAVVGQIAVMLVGVAARHQGFDVAADHLGSRIAKKFLAGLVEGKNGAALVDDDDAVDSRIEHARQPGFGYGSEAWRWLRQVAGLLLKLLQRLSSSVAVVKRSNSAM